MSTSNDTTGGNDSGSSRWWPENKPFRTWRWYQKLHYTVFYPLLLLMASPVFLVVMAWFGFFGLYAVAGNALLELRFDRRIRRQGRRITFSEAHQRMVAEGGTLIMESPTAGWGIMRAWWTPDDVEAMCPHPEPSEEEAREAASELRCLDRDRWYWEHHTSPDTGHALLVRVWNGNVAERRLRKLLPDLKCVHTWTALVFEPQPETTI